MFYRLLRAVVSFALRRFYRVRVNGTLPDLDGPLLFIGNHPNSLIDPALVFIITDRRVTFLAKEPLFRTPGIAQILKAMDALPVYRKQDHPGQTHKNEGTLEAAANALVEGRAITIFPEGKSHNEPALAELKTGAARIAFAAARRGAKVKVVPVGLTYADKDRFRSDVAIEVGAPIEVAKLLPATAEQEPEAVRALTEQMTVALRRVTLNLEDWEDLKLVRTAEQLYAFRIGDRANDPDRLRRFARGLQLFRRERPEQYERMRAEMSSFQRRLELIHADPSDLKVTYRPSVVARYAARNLAALLVGLPIFAFGVALFALPFYLSRWLPSWLDTKFDARATAKFAATLILAPLWVAFFTVAAWVLLGPAWGLLALVGILPLALFTRYFYERRRVALHDARIFFVLGSRRTLKARLMAEGQKLSEQLLALADQYRGRVQDEPGAPAPAAAGTAR